MVFPEGTRSCDGRLLPFRKGAFYIARRLLAPLEVIEIVGTGQLFRKGELLFRTGHPIRIEVRPIGRIEAAETAEAPRLDAISARVRALYGDAQRDLAATPSITS